jgi:UDP-glucose 4-epimerase
VESLIEAGHDVTVVDDLSTGTRSNLHPQAAFQEIDIRSPLLTTIFEEGQFEVVSHHAAQVDVRCSVADPVLDADVNVLGSLNLLECCRQHGVRKMIYASSGGAVYGEPEVLPCDEDHPIRPLAPYGASKYIVERYLYLYRELHGLDYTVLRYGNVYGPRQDPHGEAGVVAIFAHLMLQQESPTIHGSGEQERDFVYVEDCARANQLALRQGSGGVFNLGSGVGTSVNRLYALLKDVTGYEGEAVRGPAKPGETFRIYLDATRARDELGWQPTIGLERGLTRTVDYFRFAIKGGL